MRRGLSSAFVIIVGSVSVAIVTACSLATSFDGLSSGAVLPDGGAVDAADVVTVPDGGDGGDGGTSMPRSCRDVTGATDGIYRIDPDGSGALPSLEVFCNMTIAGGGWTLVARSAMQGAPSFGWNVKTGDLDDDAKPYSLGVDAAGIAFTSILVGVRGSGKELAGNAYMMQVKADFAKTYASSPYTTEPMAVLGTCSPPGGPEMLRYAGYTNIIDAYFLRDNGGERDPDGVTYGLFADGFRTRYDNCDQGGGTLGQQGEIFVR